MSDDDVQDVLNGTYAHAQYACLLARSLIMFPIVERVEFIFNSAGEPIQSGIVHYDQTDEGMANSVILMPSSSSLTCMIRTLG